MTADPGGAGGFPAAQDAAQLARRGITAGEARRQLALLRSPPPPVALDRPCTPGDGLETLDASRQDALLAAWRDAASAGRIERFVPASGAASRMFKSLLSVVSARSGEPLDALRARAAEGDEEARDVARLVDDLELFPFPEALRGESLAEARRGGTGWVALVEALVGESGLDYARRPKGLLPFHAGPDGRTRTAFEEHLVEAADQGRAADGTCRVHFTVSADHRGRFEDALDDARGRLEPELRVRFDVAFSEQSPSTDTIAAEPDGRPFRGPDGALLLRPGGHGALIGNLAGTGGDLVVVKNIDNVLPDARKGPALLWKKLLLGRLVELRRRVAGWLEALDEGRLAGSELAAACRDARALFGGPGSSADDAAWLRERLDRPLRVCGMVRNTGEPGGGPFWVRAADESVSPQIVESSEVDLNDGDQRRAWQSSTHFNPVDLACSLRDRHGRPYDLERFVDESRVFIARKSALGRDLLALERPGLWNGAMARWNTVFVEVPGETFAPVKTIFDLLRPEHQAR